MNVSTKRKRESRANHKERDSLMSFAHPVFNPPHFIHRLIRRTRVVIVESLPLWSHKLPFIGSAPPTSYKIDGEQYIVIPSSGGIILKLFYGDLVQQGDAIVAFKIEN